MAQDFCGAYPESREVFDRASEALDLDMLALCSEEDPRLHLTEYTQPAILTAEMAMLRGLQAHHGLAADCWGGHSLGEYTALVAAGALSLEDGVCAVRERGRLMQLAVPQGQGAMAAIIGPDLDPTEVRDSLRGLVVDIANHNAPSQVVISGATADVQLAVDRYRSTPAGRSAKVRMLQVSAPFHSRLMAPIEADFRALLAGLSWSAPASAMVVSNTSGTMHDGSLQGLLERLTGQISGTVRWVDCMLTLLQQADRVIEVGPGRPLRGFFRSLEELGQTPLHAVTNLPSARHALSD
jgi:[acyl-carrier-protein] S-malonyltransferase/trans-AT polyketide synthase/acyltransferase/oxidoreductase domain-containing protein